MKKLLFIIIAIFVFSPVNAGIKLEFYDFSLDNVDASFRFYTDSIFGARGDGLRQGGTVSTLDFNQSFTSYNPACLAFQKGPVVSFSGIPFEFVNADVVGFFAFFDPNKAFGDGLEGAIKGALQIDDASKVKVNSSTIYAAQANGITGMEGMLPFAQNGAAIGVAREEKFGFELSLLGEGIKTSMGINDPANSLFDMRLTATAGIAMDLNIKSMVTSIGLGRKISPQWGVGAVIEYIDTRISTDASAGAYAIGDVMGSSFEYGSNTLNSLVQSMKGELEAADWALRVGTSFHAPNDIAEIAVDFSIQPEFVFDGKLTGVMHTLPADSTIIEDQFLSGATTTIESPANTINGHDITMRLPSFFRTTLSWKPGPVITFNYTRFFNRLSVTIDNADMKAYYWLGTTDIFRIGINAQYFQIGGGIAVGRAGTYMDVKNDTNPPMTMNMTMPYPIGSLGFVIPIGNYVKAEVEAIAFPLPVLKTSLTISY